MVGGLGLLVVGGTAVHVVALLADEPLMATLETALTAVAATVLLYGAVHLHRRTYEAASARRIVGWALGGSVLMAGVGTLVLYSGSTVGVERLELYNTVTLSGGVGAAIGLVVGLLEARSIEETRAVERARSRAREEEQLRETVEYLNALLRHNVLNAANVISGTTEHLREHADVDHDEELRAVQERGREMADLASNVRTLLHAATVDREERPVDLAATVETAAERVRSRHPGASVTVDVPEGIHVVGDGFLEDAVECLLSAAVGYGGDPPSVTATVERADDRVHLRVRTNGRVPQRICERTFERSNEGDDDVRLLLVGIVVEPYGETTLDGSDQACTTFRLTFSPADGAGGITGSALASRVP